MNCDEAAAERGRRAATPAFLNDAKRMLEVYFILRIHTVSPFKSSLSSSLIHS